MAASWSAAALLGIDDFSHGADSWIMTGGDGQAAQDPCLPGRIRRRFDFEPWAIYDDGRALRLTPPMLTLAQCLRSAWKGEHVWGVPEIPGHGPHFLRTLQVLDRFRRVLGLSPEEVQTGCRHLFHERITRRLLRFSAPGADSPAETSLRLAIAPVAVELGGNLVPQLPIRRDGSVGESCEVVPRSRLLTVIDLADTVHRVAYYYDGDTHLERRRRDADAFITSELVRLGWAPMRVSAGVLRDPVGLRHRVRQLCARRGA